MNWSKTIENLSLIFTIIMVLIPLFNDVIDRENQSKFVKKITWSGWLLMVLGLLIIGLNFVKQRQDEDSKNDDQIKLVNKLDGHFDSSLKEYNLTYDQKTGKVINLLRFQLPIDSVLRSIRKEPPSLDISVPPFFQRKTNADSIDLDFTIKNYSNSPAINVNTEIYNILKANGKLFLIGKIPNGSRQFTTIEPEESYSYYMHYQLKPVISDTVFYFIKIKYTDESHKINKTLRSIYLIPYPTSSTIIFDASENDFTSVKGFLKTIKLWE